MKGGDSVMVENYYSFFDGNVQGLKSVIAYFSKPLYGFIFNFVKDKCVSEDILEEVFLSLIIKKRRIKDENSFKTYLYSAARNKCLDYIKRHRDKYCKLDDNLQDLRYSPEEILNKKLDIEIVKNALEKLGSDQYAVVYLSYFEQMKNKEIAKILKKSTKQVENLLYKAKVKLKKIIKELGYEE